MRSSLIILSMAALSLSTPAFAAPLQAGKCYGRYTVAHAGPEPGSQNRGANGITMKYGYIAVNDTSALPFGTFVTIPQLYGAQRFQVEDVATDPRPNMVVVWRDKLKDAVGLTQNTQICVVR